MAVTTSDPRELNGANVTGRDGEKLGKVDTVYLDNETERPEWAAVKTGMFGSHVSLVPLAVADFENGELRVPYDKDQVQKAPHHDPGRELSVDDEKELFDHYGVSYGGDTATAQGPGAGGTTGTAGQHDDRGTDRGTGRGDSSETRQDVGTTGTSQHGTSDRGTVGQDTSGPNTDDAMTRSEEELHVGTETRESGRARLRKYVVTENVTQTVPVSHEEVRLEREPITDQNVGAAHDGPEISEEEHEVVLHEERPVVGKETVAKERVRMGTETQRSEEQVSEQVRKEEIEADTGESTRGGTAREDDTTRGTTAGGTGAQR